MLSGNFEQHAQRFEATVNDVPARLKFVTAMRESIEIVHTNDYESFLKYLFPSFLKSLVPPVDASPQQLSELPTTIGRCSFYENEEIHKIRNVILEILNRLPNNDALRPHAAELLRVAMAVLKSDNEENAIISLRIIFDLHKNFSTTNPALEREVQPFIDFFTGLYANLEHTLQVNFTQQFNPNFQISPQPHPFNPQPNSVYVAANFPILPAYPILPPLPAPPANSNPGRLLLRGSDSFKVLTECPLIVMLLFQMHTKYTEENVRALIPLMMKSLQAQAPPPPPLLMIPNNAFNPNQPPSSSNSQQILSPVFAQRWKSVFSDFVAAQVKSLSFLTYVLRSFNQHMLPHSDTLATCVISLLANCPPEATNSRKELLVACRHILATEFRKSFYKKLDRLLDLDDEILIGKGRQSFELLRPLAYTTLGDLVHHVRSDMSLGQLSRVVYIFSRNVHDPTLPLGIQISSVRTILNLVDHIYRTQEQQDQRGRTLLVRILWTLTNKFETLKDLIPKKLDAFIMKREVQRVADLKAAAVTAQNAANAGVGTKDEASLATAAAAAQSAANTAAASLQNSPPIQSPIGLSSTASLLSSSSVSKEDESPEESIRDIKLLLHTMVFGLKAVVWCISNFSRGQKRNQLDEEEVLIMCRLMESGLKCFKVHNPTIPGPVNASGIPSMPTIVQIPGSTDDPVRESRELLDHFASLFMVLDSKSFRDVFNMKMECLFQQIVLDAPKFNLLYFPQLVLSNVNQSQQMGAGGAAGGANAAAGPDGRPPAPASTGVNRVFADILLPFLVKRMPEMWQPPSESNASSMLLSMFRLVFNSVSENETILRPYINPVVTNALRLATQVKHPLNYFGLLRALFRAIGGGKFEQLYKEFLPLLPELLTGLMKMHANGPQSIREITIELCLTVPARLSSLLPYIPILMKAVLLALQAADEQVIKLGLRTLEFWVDNLNPDYLYPHMCPVLNDLMRSLTQLLRPQPSSFGQTALNVLGKLGGRNRRFFIENYNLNVKKDGIEEAWNIDATWMNGSETITGSSMNLNMDSTPSQPTPAASPTSLQFSLNLDAAIEVARNLLLKDHPDRYSHALTQQLHSHPAERVPLAAPINEETGLAQQITSSISSMMNAKLVQKYNAFLLLRSALISMLDMKGDLAKFRSTLPSIESAADKSERLQREREEREREAKMEADEASYSGPVQSSVHPVVTLAPAMQALPPGATPPSSTPIQQVLSRSMAPHQRADAEGPAVSARFQHEASRTMFKQLVHAMIVASADLYLKAMDVSGTAAAETCGSSAANEVESFLEGLISHMAMVAVHLPPSISELTSKQAAYVENVMIPAQPEVKSQEETTKAAAIEAEAAKEEAGNFAQAPAFEAYHLDVGLFLDALLQALSEENRYWASAAALGLRHFIASFITLVGAERAASAPVISELLSRLVHLCYEEKWEKRHAGIIGVSMLQTALPASWALANAPELIRALLFSVKDDASAFAELSAQRSMDTLRSMVAAIATLAVEEWEKRRGSAEVLKDDVEVTQPEESEVGLTSTDAAASSTSGDADAHKSGDADTSSVSLIRSESTADTSGAAGNTDIDIHMSDGDEKTEAKDTNEKKEKDTETSSSTAAVAPVDPLAPVGKNAFDEQKSPIIRQLISLLLPELWSSVSVVRDSADELLRLLAATLHRPWEAVLVPYRHKLLTPIRQKNIHSFPLAIRTGYIAATTYSLSLPHPQLPSQTLQYFAHEVLMDPPDDQNYGNAHPATRALKMQLVTKLRVESIQLMSMAICSDEMSKSTTTTMSENDVKVRREFKELAVRHFFRSLMSRSSDVVKVAKKGLKAVIDREKLPKELLQQCLRPVLLNLADTRKLSVILLEGLARLLELLSNCFNLTLGEKLLEHLRCFAEMESLQKMRYEAVQAEKQAQINGNTQLLAQLQQMRIRPEDESKIAASIIDLFHLLPQAPDTPAASTSTNPASTAQSKFLEPLIRYTLLLEELLPVLQMPGSASAAYPPSMGKDKDKEREEREKKLALDRAPAISADSGIVSPYRVPLIKFLNVNAYKSCEVFLKQWLQSTRPRQLFLAILKDPTAAPLRKCMLDHPDLLINYTFCYEETAKKLAAAHAAAIAANQAAAGTAAPTAGGAAAMDTSSSTTPAGEGAAGAAGSSSSTSSGSAGSTSTTAAGSTSTTTPATPAPFPIPGPQDLDDRTVQGVSLTLILSSFYPEFLSAKSSTSGKTVLQHLYDVWDSDARKQRLIKEENYPSNRLAYLDETKMLVEIFLNHVRVHKDDVGILWRLLEVFKLRSLTDFTFLADFYRTEVAINYTAAQKKHAIREFLKYYQQNDISEYAKTRALKLVVIPMLKASLKEAEAKNKENDVKSPADGKTHPPLDSSDFGGVSLTPFSRSRSVEAAIGGDKMQVDEGSNSPTLAPVPSTQSPPSLNGMGSSTSQPNKPPSFSANDVLDAEMVDVIIKKLLGGGSDTIGPQDEELRIELLRFSTMLIKYLHRELVGYRKELIKFAWNHLKSNRADDTIGPSSSSSSNSSKNENQLSKFWAYVNIARFIDVYESPTRIVLQVYVALLRTHQQDVSRPLVKKALDILLPALPKRLPPEGHRYATWIKWTKKIIIEEGHQMPQLIHIWNIIIRHSDLFYHARTQFVAQMVNSLNRLGLPTNRGLEQRKVAVDLAELIIQWDRKYIKESSASPKSPTKPGEEKSEESASGDEPAAKRVKTESGAAAPAGPVASSSTASASAPNGSTMIDEGRVNGVMIELITTFLVRLALTMWEHADTKPILKRCIKLLREAGELWKGTPGGEMKLVYIEKILGSVPETNALLMLYATTIDVMCILLNFHPQQFMVRAMPSIDKIISMCCKHSPMGVGTIRDGCCEMLTIITKELPLQAAIQPSEEVVRFYKNLKENIFNALKNSEKQTVSLQIALLGVILKGCPSYLDTNFPSIVKVVQKLAKDHVTRSPHAKPTSQDEKAKYYQLTDTLKRGLQIIADRIGMVGEHKKAYLSTLAHLIDKSTDISLMADITKTIAPWITSNETAAPNGALPGLPPPAIPASTSSGAAPMDTSATGAASAPAEGAAPPPPAAGSSSPSLSGLSNVAVNPPPGTILSSKEKANFVLKMCRFDRFDAPELLHRLLDIVLTCFSSKSMKSSDWLTKLQRAFMLGLRCRDLTYRDQFIALFHQHISPTVWDRLNYIFQLQDWENLSDSFWMTQATDLLLSIVKDEEEIVASNGNVNVNATTPRAVAGAVPRRYNQLVMPSFDSAYWKNGDNIDHIAKEDKQRVQTLAKQRLATNKAQAAETSADGDENMLDSVLALQPRRRAAKVNRKKRTHTKAFNADEKKLTVVVKDSTATGAAASIYTPVNFSSPPTCFAVLSNGQEDLTFLRSVLNTPDPHAYRASFMQHQSKWFLNHSSNPSSNLIEPLRDLINTSPDMTGKIWSGLFPHAWSKLNTDQRQELVNPINSLLSKDWHSRLPCDKDHLHPVQVLLESFLHCHPTPAVIPELLRFMAKTYNSWQICISLLEQRILPLGNDVPFSNNIPSYNALSYLYRELGEEDVWHGLWRRRVVSDYSHTALALEQFSMWPRAQDYLYTAMNKKHIGGEAASAEIGPVGLSETVMWEEEWVRCSRHLNQWEILKDFAHQIGHLELQWEAAWRLGDWNTLRDMCQKHSSVDIPNAKLYQISLAIHDRKSAEVLLAQAQAAAAAAGAPAPTQAPQPVDLMKMMESIVQSALREWQSLPTFVGNSHIGMLQRFQRIVEFTESSGIVNDMMSAQRNTAPQALVPPNVQNVLKNIITTWKERLLNKWEELPVWSEILTWRCHMFSIILRTYASGQETVPQYARFHDLPWTVIKLAQVARKQQLPAVCLQILSKINHFSQLDASDMFTRLREQIKTCLQSHAELNAALNILSSTNLDYFNTEQKAEMFRLKGEALQHLGYGDESNCFPVEDHEVLTADGFVGYTEFRRRVDAGEAVSVACPRQSGVLEYHSIKADRLIEKVGPHALVQIKQEITSGKVRSNVDLVVTGNHRMWVKVAAEELLDQVKEFSISRADSLVDRRDPSGSEQFAKFVGNSEHGVQRATARCLPFVQPLGLHTDAQISAFLELYGYWFANGSLEQGRVVAFNPQEQDVEFVTGLLARIGVAHQNCRITDSQWSLFFHEHYFARWVFEQLDASQLRSILRGLRMANEENDVIITSSARFRDELQTIALMAGYTCHWTRRGDQYAVVFSAEESVSQPVLSCAKEIKSVPFVAGAPHRKVWCVSVPTSEQLIVVRRVTQRHEGRIVEASRPIVMGNTAFSACLSISDTYGKGWASWAAFCDRVFTLKKDVQWADHALTCFPESDTRVLTDKGFLFLNQIEALIAAGTPPLYASYSKDRQQIDYVEGKLVFKQNPPERLVDFTQAATRSLWEASSQGTESANHMSIRVTPDHDMFVQVGSHDAHTGTFNPIACDGIEQPYAKVPAEQLASGFKCDCDNHDSCYHGRRSIRMLAQVHSGVNVEMNMDAEPVHRLGLQTTAQLNAFLQIYGLWLASGSLSTDGIVLSDVECLVGTLSASGLIEDRDWVRAASSAIVISKATWVSYFEEEYWIHEEQLRVQRESAAVGSIAARRLELAAQFGVTVSELDVDSAKWFFPWMLQSLSRAQVRLVLAGLQQSTKGSLQIATRGAHMRDEIVRACIHAGFSAVTSAGANAQEWCVSYTENASTFIETIDVRHDSSEALSPLYDPVKDGRLWCITLPASTDRLLIAQRARVGKSGVVEQASRPVIVGNCYIQAISNKFKRATLNMSRILYLLSFDSYGGPVIKAFQRFAEHIPLWVWIMWIPQLLSSLARPEGAMVKVLLSKIAKAYPQSLYYTMRAYLIELRDARQNSLQYNPPAEQPAQQASQAAAAASAAAAPVKKEGESSDSAMTDAASASASSSSASGSTTSGATTSESAAAGDANLSNTSQASFQAGTPASLAKPPAPATTSQPLRGDAEPEQAAEALANAQATNSTAVAQANASGSAAASSSSTSGSSSSTSAPAGAPAPPKPEAAAPPHPNQSIAWIEDVCNVVRVTHRSVIGEIEKMIDEFSRRFKPEPEEELLNAVYALLLKAVKHPPTPFDIVPPVLQGTVERVCKKFFVTELVASATQKRHIAFVQKYKESFERDFMPSFPVTNAQPGQSTTVPNSRFPTTCNDLIQRLKRWKTHLLFVIGCTSNVHLKLEKLSSYLIRFQSWDIEIPGQFIHDREPDALNHVVIQRFDPMVKVYHSHGFSTRRIAMIGDDGKPYYFFVQYQISHITRSDERMMQLYVLLNRLMRNYKETRKRHLVHHVPIVIPLTHRLRLAETNTGHVSFEDIYDESCHVRKVDRDAPLFIYRDAMKKIGNQNNDSTTQMAARLKVYNEITTQVVPDTILSRFIHRSIPSNDQLWTFRQQLCSQLALSGFLSYLMKIGERQLHRIALLKQNGRLINSEFYPTYNESGIIESNEPVPFRLTRNLQMALSPTLIDGLFSATIMAANSCLLTNQDILKNYMSLFIRDDLLSWNSSKSIIETDVRQRELEKLNREKVQQNTNMVLKRIHMLMPTPHQQPSAAERAAQQAAGHPVPNPANQPQPLNHKIHLLIKVATSKQKLCTMGPQWAPWF